MAAIALTAFSLAPAGAEPADNPCALTSVFFCRLLPIAPDLEGDIDLTQQQRPIDPAVPVPDSPS
ncbi:fibronectin-binding protein [Mycolicibacterium sp. jd]|uniref:fibronectin-binding protein n=1 Tax=unclassified Mycolicibacterium TaxID=2636767 RepID=UPI00351BD814